MRALRGVALAALVALLACLLVLSPTPASAASKKRKSSSSSSSGGVELSESFFEQWAPFKDLEKFMDLLYKTYKSSKLITTSSIGKSAEKRKLTLLSIGSSTPKYQLFLMATMHGREWITPYATLYTAWQLLKCHEEGEQKCVDLLASTQVHFLPVLNPDGYEFTRLPPSKNEQARQWRKNRRNLCSKCERAVHGIDLNRNWGVKDKSWGFGNDKATTEVYQGKHPFSEPEIKAVRDWLLHKSRAKSINAFFDVHCCSGAILPPFYYNGESEVVQSKNLDNCKSIAKAMRSVNNMRYKWRPREQEFSASNTGIGVDWIYAEAGIPNVFIVETRGNKTKLLKDIFEVPETEIIPIAKELEAGFWKMAELFANEQAVAISEVTSLTDNVPAASLSADDAAKALDMLSEGSTASETQSKGLRGDSSSSSSMYNDDSDAGFGDSSGGGASEVEEDVKPGDMSLDDLLSAFDDPAISSKAKKPKPVPKPSASEVKVETKPTIKQSQERLLESEKKKPAVVQNDDKELEEDSSNSDVLETGDEQVTTSDTFSEDDDAFSFDASEVSLDSIVASKSPIKGLGTTGKSASAQDEENIEDETSGEAEDGEEEEEEDDGDSEEVGDDDDDDDDDDEEEEEEEEEEEKKDNEDEDEEDDFEASDYGNRPSKKASALSSNSDQGVKDDEDDEAFAAFAALGVDSESSNDDFSLEPLGSVVSAKKTSSSSTSALKSKDSQEPKEAQYDDDHETLDADAEEDSDVEWDSGAFEKRVDREAHDLLGDDDDNEDAIDDSADDSADAEAKRLSNAIHEELLHRRSADGDRAMSEKERQERLANYRRMRQEMDPKMREEILAMHNSNPGRYMRWAGAGILIFGVCSLALIASRRRRNRFKGE